MIDILFWRIYVVLQTIPTRIEDAGDATWTDRIQQWFRDRVGGLIKGFHEPIDNWLGQLPMSVALGCAIALYAIALTWVWSLRREFVFRGSPDQKPWRDLRIWATIVVIPYVAVYLLLGR